MSASTAPLSPTPRPTARHSGNPLVANAFAVWSTTDASTDPNQHFDGIIDPAGFFDATGTQIVMPDANGLYPISTADAPASGAYLPHVVFYQTTLLNFVNNPFDTMPSREASAAPCFRSEQMPR